MKKYYYSLMDLKNNPKLISGQLPIYWTKTAADNVAKNFTNIKVQRISAHSVESAIRNKV